MTSRPSGALASTNRTLRGFGSLTLCPQTSAGSDLFASDGRIVDASKAPRVLNVAELASVDGVAAHSRFMNMISRTAAGVPEGGEFAARTKTADDVELRNMMDMRARFAAASKIRDDFRAASRDQMQDLGLIHAAINDGAWGDLREQALAAHRDIADFEADEATSRGLDGSELMLVNPVAGLTDEWEWEFHTESGRHVIEHRAAGAVTDAIRALAYADYVDDLRFPGLTEEAHHHLLRPWVTAFDAVVPGTSGAHPSWKRRALDSRALDWVSPAAHVRAVRLAKEAMAMSQTAGASGVSQPVE